MAAGQQQAPPNARTPEYARLADAEARRKEAEAREVKKAMRAQLRALWAQEAARADLAMQRWPEVSRLVSITRARHVRELAALREAAAAALEPFEAARSAPRQDKTFFPDCRVPRRRQGPEEQP